MWTSFGHSGIGNIIRLAYFEWFRYPASCVWIKKPQEVRASVKALLSPNCFSIFRTEHELLVNMLLIILNRIFSWDIRRTYHLAIETICGNHGKNSTQKVDIPRWHNFAQLSRIYVEKYNRHAQASLGSLERLEPISVSLRQLLLVTCIRNSRHMAAENH